MKPTPRHQKRYGYELEFLQRIKADGSGGLHPSSDVDEAFKDTEFELFTLSLTHKTFIAQNMSTWVVKIKEECL